MQHFHHRLWCLLNFSNVSFTLISSWLWHVFKNKINKKYMSLSKIDISSRKKVDIANYYLCFSMLQLNRNRDKRMFFFFYNQISFPFSCSCTCLMGTFKKTEYNPICKVFTEVFLIARIPHSTFLIHFCQRESAILWPLW